MYRTVFRNLWEKVREGWSERMALKHVYYHIWNIASPGPMRETGCSGLIHWDDPDWWDVEGSGRGGSGWGTHVNPWLIHINVWQKPLQYCKLISLQLKLKKKNLLAKQETWVWSLGWEIPLGKWQHTPIFLPGDPRGAWWATVHEMVKDCNIQGFSEKNVDAHIITV